MEAVKRKRGRPPGSRNRPLPPAAVRPQVGIAKADYQHSDPDTIVARQLTMLDWAQQLMREEMQLAMLGDDTKRLYYQDVQKLEKLSNAIVRAIEALKKSADLADELSSRLTPEQLLEAALKKVEAQDRPTVNYAIKRLRAHAERLTAVESSPAAPADTATDAIASLGA